MLEFENIVDNFAPASDLRAISNGFDLFNLSYRDIIYYTNELVKAIDEDMYKVAKKGEKKHDINIFIEREDDYIATDGDIDAYGKWRV